VGKSGGISPVKKRRYLIFIYVSFIASPHYPA
jgi:hypothetical protein